MNRQILQSILFRAGRRLHRALLVGPLLVFALNAEAEAVERSCGANPVANTAAVLCAPPSGPCTTNEVTLGGNLEVTSGGCAFDLGGRSLRVAKTLEMIGSGFIVVDNVGDITITSTGKLKARGDFVRPNGQIVGGGRILLTSSGAINVSGRIDVTGDAAGEVRLVSQGELAVQASGILQANGISTSADDGERYADGGTITLSSVAGDVRLGGVVSLTGQNHGGGGDLQVSAGRSVFVTQPIQATGGAGNGGNVELRAADDVYISRPIDVDGVSGGGSGGAITIDAGEDSLGGIAVGGSITIDDTTLQLNGQGSEGEGGEFVASSRGPIVMRGSAPAIRANAATASSGSGGTIAMRALAKESTQSGSDNRDVSIVGSLLAQGGSAGGRGGDIDLAAGRTLDSNAAIIATGPDGGNVTLAAGGDLAVRQPVDSHATNAAGTGGNISITAGSARDARLDVAADLRSNGGTTNGRRQGVTLAGCAVNLAANVTIDGRAGTAPSGALGGAKLLVASRRALSVQPNTRLLAGPGGNIVLVHPPEVSPVLGAGVVMEPPRLDDTASVRFFPLCVQVESATSSASIPASVASFQAAGAPAR